jgi:hypothetical protein
VAVLAFFCSFGLFTEFTARAEAGDADAACYIGLVYYPAFLSAFLLSAHTRRLNEPPVQEENENVCWPFTGSGEIDIFEHHGDHGTDQFTTGAIRSLGECASTCRMLI